MFEIHLDRTIEDSASLWHQVNEMRTMPDEAGAIKSKLQTLSCMDGPIENLNRVIGQLEEQQVTLNNLSQGFDKILWMYQSGENRICDNAEQNVIRYGKMNLVNINLDQISALLTDVSLQ